MKKSAWYDYKSALISKYQPDKIVEDTEWTFEFVLGGYSFRFETAPSPLQNFGEEVNVLMNARYAFVHIGIWRDMKTPTEISTKLALAKKDADDNTRYRDLDHIPKKKRKEAEERETKITFKRK
jgi:hypothetical protein